MANSLEAESEVAGVHHDLTGLRRDIRIEADIDSVMEGTGDTELAMATQVLETHEVDAKATGSAMLLEANVEVAGVNPDLTAPRRDTTSEQGSDIDAAIDLAMEGNGNATASVSIGHDADLGTAHPAPHTLPNSNVVSLLLLISPTSEDSSHVPRNRSRSRSCRSPIPPDQLCQSP